MGSKKHRRPRDVPHRKRGLASDDSARDREFRPGRGLEARPGRCRERERERERERDGARHSRGANVRQGLPGRRRKDFVSRATLEGGPHIRVPGTNGSWPAAPYPPQPPPLLMLHENDHYEEPVAVFGQYPRGLIERLLPWLRCERRELLHVCSGSLPRGEGIRVDIRQEARPDILADGRALPFRDGSVKAVMLDPPYTEQYARDLYGVRYPRPSHLLAEAARVVRPCGRIIFVHFIVPNPPDGCRLVTVRTFSTGCGFAVRAATVFEREQDELPLGAA